MASLFTFLTVSWWTDVINIGFVQLSIFSFMVSALFVSWWLRNSFHRDYEDCFLYCFQKLHIIEFAISWRLVFYMYDAEVRFLLFFHMDIQVYQCYLLKKSSFFTALKCQVCYKSNVCVCVYCWPQYCLIFYTLPSNDTSENGSVVSESLQPMYSVYGILQARIPEQEAFPSSMGSNPGVEPKSPILQSDSLPA